MQDPRVVVGSVFQDRYEILHKLSEGGYGVVYKGRQLTTGQSVAIKCLHRHGSSDDEHQDNLARFRREMVLCAQLHHPNIVRLIDSGQEGSVLYTVFEFVPGKNLADVLAEEGQLAPVEAGHLMTQVVDALGCAHSLGIIHRDLKPSNIMIVDTGARRNALILDFGIGAITDSAYQTSDYINLTSPTDRMGTPAYAAPEQLRGEPVDASADLYSWGLLFLECLTGRRAIPGRVLAEVIHQQLDEAPVLIPLALRGHPLDELFRSVTAKDPYHRKLPAHIVFQRLEACDLSGLDLAPRRDGSVVMQSVDTLETLGLRTPVEFSVERAPSGSRTSGGARSTAPGVSGERRQITATSFAFRVIAGAAGPDDLEEAAELTATAKALCTDIVQDHGGHVSRGLGRQVLVFFGYPRAHDDDARRAVHATLAVVEALAGLSGPTAGGPRVVAHIGVHTGVVIVRASEHDGAHDDGDIFGDPPELATAIGELADDNAVLVSRATERLLGGAFISVAAGAHGVGPSNLRVELLQILGREHVGVSDTDSRSKRALPLVGREEELALLLRAWRGATDGRGRAVLVSGEAGIGKSRLTQELRHTISGQRHAWLESRCSPDARHAALHPIAEMLEHSLGIHGGLDVDEKLRALEAMVAEHDIERERAVPLLAELLGVPTSGRYPPIAGSPQRRRAMTLDTLLSLLVSLAGQRPLVLLVEDLHWADPSTLELVSLLLGEVPVSPICLLLTARPGLTTPWTGTAVTQLELGGLTSGAVTEIVRGVVRSADLPLSVIDSVIDRVVARTDGVPLFVEELTRTILESGQAQFLGRGDVATAFAEIDVPATLRDSLMARLDRLERAKPLAQLAAVIGREFTRAQIEAASEMAAASLDAALDELVRSGLVYQQRRLAGARYVFRHALIQDTAYDSLPRRDRARLHERIAVAFEDRFPDLVSRRPEVMAHHYVRAGDLATAVEYGLRAAQGALDRSANREAIAYCEAALEWLARRDEDVGRAESELAITAVLTPALMATYGYSDERFEARMLRSLELLDKKRDREPMTAEAAQTAAQHAFVALWGLFAFHLTRGDYVRALPFARRYVAHAEAGDSDEARALLAEHRVAGYGLLGMLASFQGHQGEAREHLERALAAAVSWPDQKQAHYGYDLQVLTRCYLGLVLYQSGAPAHGAGEIARAVARAEAVEHPISLALSLMFRALIHYYEDQRPQVLADAERMIAVADKTGLPRWRTFGEILASWAARDPVAGRAALARYHDEGHRLRVTYLVALVAEAEAAAGEVDAAIAHLDDCVRLADTTTERAHLPRVLHMRGKLRAERGDEEGALEALSQAVETARRSAAHLLALHAGVTWCALRRARAERSGDAGAADAARRELQSLYDAIADGHERPSVASARAFLDAWPTTQLSRSGLASDAPALTTTPASGSASDLMHDKRKDPR